MENHCKKCGGFIGEPMKAYGYAGKWCHCPLPEPIKQFSEPSPLINETFVPTAIEVKKEIRRIYVEHIGWIWNHTNHKTQKKWHERGANAEIEEFRKGDDSVPWYRQGDSEYNGRFVTSIEYVDYGTENTTGVQG